MGSGETEGQKNSISKAALFYSERETRHKEVLDSWSKSAMHFFVCSNIKFMACLSHVNTGLCSGIIQRRSKADGFIGQTFFWCV
jgi:hypothetical protein